MKKSNILTVVGIVLVLCILIGGIVMQKAQNKASVVSDDTAQEKTEKEQVTTQTAEEETFYGDDGMVYQYIRTDGYEVKMNINQMKVTGQIPLYSGEGREIKKKSIGRDINGKYYQVYYFLIPEVFMTDDTITQITYTLQNAAGSMQIEPQTEKIGEKSPFGTKVCEESLPAVFKRGSADCLYMKIYFNVEENTSAIWEKVCKEQLEKLVIRADIEYEDGTKAVKYAGLKAANAYNTDYFCFHELVME